MIGRSADTPEAIEFKSTEQDKCQETENYSSDDRNEPGSSISDCSLDQSFEIISSAKTNMDSDDEGNPGSVSVSGKPRSNSENLNSSFQSRLKKSDTFLSRLQSSSDGKESTNIPSSIASAFSSFTSNFTLNSSTNANNHASSLIIETGSTSTKLSQIAETREDIFNKKAATERKNLINLTKLIVRDLISSSLLASRTIDDCQNAVHLNNYFTLIDRVLKHGLRQNLLSNRSASLWNALDNLPKYLKDSTLMSESIRSLANTKTPDGKIKAWMRLAMMQKKLPEYINELLANRNTLLKDVYHDYAFMLNDEAHVFAGLIIGVNVIDCNFFVKDANFDMMDGIIDLSPYLRVASSTDSDIDTSDVESRADLGLENLTTVLDQKNYLEEWNKRLEATIHDLQTKIKFLEEQNSTLAMEVKISEAKIEKFEKRENDPSYGRQNAVGSSSITDAIKNLIGNSDNHLKQIFESSSASDEVAASHVKKPNDQTIENVPEVDLDETHEKDGSDLKDDHKEASCGSSSNVETKSLSEPSLSTQQSNLELQKQLSERGKELNGLRERASILEASYRAALDRIRLLERDLDIQTTMNADKETTIKIYEKDIRDKQAQVESLRTSLDDSKKLQSDLNERLNDANNKLKDRIKSVSNLQASLDKWKLENKTLASRLQDKQVALRSVTNDLEDALKTIASLKNYNEKINNELKKERESGQSSSVTVETQNAEILALTTKLASLEKELKLVKPFKDQTEELAKRCRDYEQSLEEIGTQLLESRLEVENLKENSAVFLDSQWIDSKQAKSCVLCQQSFSVTRRKHHCRLCGNVFCQTCSDNKMELASSAKPVRVCDTCHAFLLAKFVKSSA